MRNIAIFINIKIALFAMTVHHTTHTTIYALYHPSLCLEILYSYIKYTTKFQYINLHREPDVGNFGK